MSVLFVLPALIAIFFIARRRIDTAILSVYLPTLLLLPDTYSLRIPHVPPLSAAQFALLPVGLLALGRLLSGGRRVLMDLLVALFVISLALSEVLRERVMNDGIFTAITGFVSIGLSYAVGRKLIEPELRLATVQRIVLLMLILGPTGLMEWRLGQSIYGILGDKIFQVATPSTVQLRGGHGRIGVSFSDAEIAGIAFGMTATLNAWLYYLYKRRGGAGLSRIFTRLEKRHLAGIALLVCLYLTSSRGPMIAVAAAYLILQIPRYKNTRAATIAVALILAAGGAAAYQHFNSVSAGPSGKIANEEQGSILYRKQMNEEYAVVAKAGGWLGYGQMNRPVLNGMASIDNEFLLVHLSQGEFGYIVFVLIVLENVRVLVARSWTMESPDDRTFVFSMLAAMTVLWISLATVYMGSQLPQLTFLLIGWGQSIVAGKSPSASSAEPAVARTKFAFRRVFN